MNVQKKRKILVMLIDTDFNNWCYTTARSASEVL